VALGLRGGGCGGGLGGADAAGDNGWRWETGELLQRRQRREVAAKVQDDGGEEGEGWGGGPHLGTA
jgi:hypothetical protein